MSGSAVVIGSLHVDLIARADRLPGRGESVTGGSFSMAPGGKAGNQAIQLALCGIETTLVSRVGDDDFGTMLRAALRTKGVRDHRIVVDQEAPTGASTVLAAEGDYASIITPGAANNLSRFDLEAALSEIKRADLVVLQRELSQSFVEAAIEFCAGLNKLIMFNASPAPWSGDQLSGLRWDAVEWLVVNRVEAGVLANSTVVDAEDAVELAEGLRQRYGVANVVITLGREGSVWVGDEGREITPSFEAAVVDTVGAGDAFLGALAACVVNRIDVRDGLRRASAAGAIAVGRAGAYDALPNDPEIDRFLLTVGSPVRTALK